jgi:N-acetylglucosamine kinase-like BadF-type ATPase
VAIYLGIDGGGTKTTCVVTDENNILGTATSGGSNITRHGDARVREALHGAVRDACAAAKVDPATVVSACVGLSGAGRPEVRDAVTRMMREVLRGKIEVVTDLETTLEAAFDDGPGVITIAGTGSIAYGRDAGGQTARAGGWGLAISDEGSGQWIGRAAVSAVLGAKDAGEDPALLKPILELWKLTTLDELVRHANASPPPDFSSLVPLVLDAAENPRPSGAWTGHPSQSDALARNVLERAGNELAALARNVVRRLFGAGGSVRVAMAGGVFRQSEIVRTVFYNVVIAEFPQATVQAQIVDAADGALALARKAAR